ncbi:MAG: ABC transporter ATP-binding protein [Bacteroidota bacterium]
MQLSNLLLSFELNQKAVMLATQDLAFSYPQGPELRFPDINCTAGEHWLLLGHSGSGKTTMLQLLAGLRAPSSGKILVADTEINQLPPSQLDVFRGQHIGLVFQQHHFVRALRVWENLAIAQQLAGKPVDRERISALLEQLKIQHKLDARPSQLSVGEQQRLSIARAIVNRPQLILADEPTSALDDQNAEQVLSLLQEQAQAVNATLLIITHDNRLTSKIHQQISL